MLPELSANALLDPTYFQSQQDLDSDSGNQCIDLTGPDLKEYIITSCYTIDASHER